MIENNAPYYHSNINQNNKEIIRLCQALLDNYSTVKDVTISNGAPGVVNSVSWSHLATKYQLEQYTGETAEIYGDSHMLTITETYGEEQSIKTLVYTKTPKNISLVTHVIQLTSQQQKERDDWWEANKYQDANGNWLAIRPDTTDDIARESEMLIYALETAETLLNK